MTIDQIIALTASLGAGLSAIAAVVVVFQNTVQLRASLQPDLVVPVFGFRTDGEGPALGRSWVEYGGDAGMARLKLVNVGREAAKDVNLTWGFPVEETIAKLNSAFERIPSCEFRLEYFAGFVCLKQASEAKGMVAWRGCQRAHLDFVLPISIERPDTRIMLPPAYSVLAGALIYCAISRDEFGRFLEVPELTLDLEYRDIGGNKYQKSLSLTVEISTIQDVGATISGQLKAKIRAEKSERKPEKS